MRYMTICDAEKLKALQCDTLFALSKLYTSLFDSHMHIAPQPYTSERLTFNVMFIISRETVLVNVVEIFYIQLIFSLFGFFVMF